MKRYWYGILLSKGLGRLYHNHTSHWNWLKESEEEFVYQLVDIIQIMWILSIKNNYHNYWKKHQIGEKLTDLLLLSEEITILIKERSVVPTTMTKDTPKWVTLVGWSILIEYTTIRSGMSDRRTVDELVHRGWQGGRSDVYYMSRWHSTNSNEHRIHQLVHAAISYHCW